MEIFSESVEQYRTPTSYQTIRDRFGDDYLSGLLGVVHEVALQVAGPIERTIVVSDSDSIDDFLDDLTDLNKSRKLTDADVARFGQQVIDSWKHVAQIQCSRILQEKAEYNLKRERIREMEKKALRKDGGKNFYGGGDTL